MSKKKKKQWNGKEAGTYSKSFNWALNMQAERNFTLFTSVRKLLTVISEEANFQKGIFSIHCLANTRATSV